MRSIPPDDVPPLLAEIPRKPKRLFVRGALPPADTSIYPATNRKLAIGILEAGGALVSEYGAATTAANIALSTLLIRGFITERMGKIERV